MQSFNYRALWFILAYFLIGSMALKSQSMEFTESVLAYNTGEAYLMSAEIVNSPSQQGGIIDNQRIRIINLGPIINHAGADYAPTISADGRTLFYVSNRPGSRLNADGNPSHDFWAAKKGDRLDTVFSTPYNIDEVIGLDYLNVNTEFNEGVASIAADRQTLYFTACNRPDGLGSCDIYRSIIDGDKWGRPVNLGRNVNSDNFDSQPSISPDQRRLYFVSSRSGPNSNGKPIMKNMDLWYCDWDDDNEEWMPAKNLEEINTSGTEYSPFIAADNSTLFFSSDGHRPNYGGLDFYVSRKDEITGKFGKPENLGDQLNTKEDEMFITLPASGDVLYFSSRRDDLAGYQGNLDVFMAFVPSFFKAMNLITTVVDECSQEFIPATITVKNPLTARTVSDEITNFRKEHELIISNQDYGNPKDSLPYVDLEVTAFNPKYGTKTVVQRIERPGITEDPDEVKRPDEVRLTITLGQRPELVADINEPEYIRMVKASQPQLASFRGLVMKETKTWNLYPLLNYVFFEPGSSEIPERYILLDSYDQTGIFTDTTILGGTLDKYYHVMNIYGYRLTNHPDAKIEIVGTIDMEVEKDSKLAAARAQKVYNYFRDVWKIDESRMTLGKHGKPEHPTSTRIDSIGVQENRRVEIRCTNWDVVKPVFDVGSITEPQPRTMNWKMKNGIEDQLVAKRRIEITRNNQNWRTLTDVGLTDEQVNWNWTNMAREYPTDELSYTAQLVITTQTGAECKSDPVTIPVMQVSSTRMVTEGTIDTTRETYNLILFPFDSDNAGPINSRIMQEYVYERCRPSSVIDVIGHTDVVGMYDHNKKLSERRSETVRQGINKQTGGKYNTLTSNGVGEEDPLYSNDLPEGRFYNRTVQVIVRTPLTEYEGEY
ncbi:MAG: hypothetical protein CVV22_12495 [Ignavibacteriae bacterium HGW-Ignavibacteriae-1]|jgi:outer membrane protein OmpA-like peptidoglycan-associated protein|nr:MAG: hypothetical protein CVV22_12495 [Ignavibacteriae bacterium HGW-Ignavibacteriae-1]